VHSESKTFNFATTEAFRWVADEFQPSKPARKRFFRNEALWILHFPDWFPFLSLSSASEQYAEIAVFFTNCSISAEFLNLHVCQVDNINFLLCVKFQRLH
jgi:hypothetical protein